VSAAIDVLNPRRLKRVAIASQPHGGLKALLFCLLFLSTPGLARAQEVEGNGKGAGALFSPADYLEISTPLTGHVATNVYGFYVGNLQAGIALIEVPAKLLNHVTVTPSYLFINVAASGLALLTQEPENTPFMFDEVYHDFAPGNWLRRNWVVAGVDLPAARHITFQVSYIRQYDQYLRSVNFIGLAVLVRTGKPFSRK
jgi:hypothetical protein